MPGSSSCSSRARSARPAGPIFAHEGRLYRPAQDCSRTYGGAVVIHRIEALTPEIFREVAVARLDPELAQAARTMGASPLRTFATVTLPLLRAPILGAAILVFVFVLGAYLLPQLLGRPQHWTLSVHITDQAIYQSNLPLAVAMAVLLLVVALTLVGLSLLLTRERREAAP